MAITIRPLAERMTLRQMNTRGLLWQTLAREWLSAEEVVDITVEDDTLQDSLIDAIENENAVTLMVLVDQAEEKGVSPELCALTRAGLRHYYPQTR